VTETGRLYELCRSAAAAVNGSAVDDAQQQPAATVVSNGEPPASSGSSAATVGQPPIYASIVKIDRTYQQLSTTDESVPRYEFIVVENDQPQDQVEERPSDGEPNLQTQNNTDDEQPSAIPSVPYR